MLLRTPKDIGAMMRATRRRLGLDQATVAARAGVSRLWLIEAEKGKPGAEIGLVLRTLRVLGVALCVDTDGSTSSDVPDIDTPDIDTPDIDTPDIDTPDIDAVIDETRYQDR